MAPRAKSVEPKAPRSRSRSASVSAADVKAADSAKAPATPAKGRGKRPRVSDVAEEGQDGAATVAATPSRAKRGKTPTAADTPAKGRAKRESTPSASTAKKPRLSELPKPPKVGMNPLPASMPLVNSMPAYKLDPPYTLPKDVDPTKEGNAPLSVFVCGTGDFGQLGLGVEVLSEVPRPRLHKWFEENSRAPASNTDTAAPTNGAETETADKKEASTTPVLGKHGIEDLASGGMHSLAVDSEGKVWSWGINDSGSLGRITVLPDSDIEAEELETKPMLVEGLDKDEFRAVAVAAGDGCSVALSDKGELRGWGSFRSKEGHLGFGNAPGAPQYQFSPVSFPALKKHPIVQVVCGQDHVLALTTDGQVFAYGNGQQSQLGRKIIERRLTAGLTPEKMGLRKIVYIASGAYHSFAKDDKGRIYAWGLNGNSQSGITEGYRASEPIIDVPTLVTEFDGESYGGAKVVQIAAGEFHTLFLLDNGDVYAVGRNDAGQLGLGEQHESLQLPGTINAYATSPQKVTFPDSETNLGQETKIVRVVCGTRHCMAVSATGEVYGWGANSSVHLGLGPDSDFETVYTPLRIKSKAMTDYKVLSASTVGQHSLFIAAKSA